MKLIIFALALGGVPISAYFLSRDYLWEGASTLVQTTHPPLILARSLRQRKLRRHHGHCLCQPCPGCIYHRVHQRRVAHPRTRKAATACGVEEGPVARQSILLHSITCASPRGIYPCCPSRASSRASQHQLVIRDVQPHAEFAPDLRQGSPQLEPVLGPEPCSARVVCGYSCCFAVSLLWKRVQADAPSPMIVWNRSPCFLVFWSVCSSSFAPTPQARKSLCTYSDSSAVLYGQLRFPVQISLRITAHPSYAGRML